LGRSNGRFGCPNAILRFHDTFVLQLFLFLIVDQGRFSRCDGRFGLLYLSGEIVIS